jgi:MFS family permease
MGTFAELKTERPPRSAWAPLSRPLFRSLWIASIVSNVGTWMQNVGGVWLMAELSASPLHVALMQAATSLPVFLVGLLAGALADILDRRRMLIVAQVWMLAAAAALGVLTLLGMTTPSILLLLTFVLGLGAALNAPVWQAIVPEIAGREDLSEAVALSGVGYNIARVIGPAIGGAVVAAAGSSANFFLNALSFLGVILVIHQWKREKVESALPGECVIGAIRAGLRYAQHAPLLQSVLIRAGLFMVFASAIWALLPVVVRDDLNLGSGGYGLLLGCLGGGSLLGAALLPRVSRIMSLDKRLVIASLLLALGCFSLAFVHNIYFLCVMMFISGLGWLTVMVGVNVATQSVVPLWVQARALALYSIVTQGGLALGSTAWGTIATQTSHSVALGAAGIGLSLGIVAAYLWPLARVGNSDLTPSADWDDLNAMGERDPDEGPVMVTVEYIVATNQIELFRDAMNDLRQIRRRDGAIRWELYEDMAIPGRVVELFVVESWAEHLRQHARITKSDRDAERNVRSFHIGNSPPRVSHFIYSSKK